ncbi:MAG: 1-acyl-sn-glycerol-3-phosphate acyltransferase [Tenericutes bacterium]|nr:1-acyl-sn-glycerol-3-phosphate acyltransferase [Mycoplasmatota bacterium]
MNYFVYKFVYYVGKIVFQLLYFPRFYGRENIPKEGAVILAGNHTSNWDAAFVIVGPKRVVRAVSKKELFRTKFKSWFFKSMGCIRVDRSIHDDDMKSEVLKCLNNQEVVVIFPEGTVNRTDKLMLPFKYGAVSFAQKTGAYVVPFAITGKYKLFKKSVKIEYGTAYKIDKNSKLSNENEILFNKVKELVVKGNKL